MFLALWEFEVKPDSHERFVSVYGPDGDWAQLFKRDAHFHETRLLRDPFRTHIYLTLDIWESREAYERFKSKHDDDYRAIDEIGEGLTVSEKKIGMFEEI